MHTGAGASNIKKLEKDDSQFAGNHTHKFHNYGLLRRNEGPNCVIITSKS